MQSQGNMHKDETFMGTEVNLVKSPTLAQTSSLSLECQASSKEDDSSCGLYPASWISAPAINLLLSKLEEISMQQKDGHAIVQFLLKNKVNRPELSCM